MAEPEQPPRSETVQHQPPKPSTLPMLLLAIVAVSALFVAVALGARLLLDR